MCRDTAIHKSLSYFSFYIKINSLNHLIEEITSYSKNFRNFNENEYRDQKNLLKKILGSEYEDKSLLDKYVNLYTKIYGQVKI